MMLSVDNKQQVPRVASSASLTPINKALINEHVSSEWKKCFEKSSKILNPSFDRLTAIAEKNEQSIFSRFAIKSLECSFPRITNIESTSRIKIQISLFDMAYKTFIGRTWHGPSKALKKSHGKTSLNYEENTYFHTSLHDNHILIVIEAVAVLNDNKKKSCGWTAFRPFSVNSRVETTGSTQRLGFYHGTPRALLFMDDPWEKNDALKAITGCYLLYTFKNVNVPERIKVLIPENVFVGAYDKICGVVDNDTDTLEKPRLILPNAAIIEELYINLNPNVNKFETELCALIAEDKSYWEKIQIDPGSMVINERRLKIAVHNGWNYTHEPYIVQLTVESGKNKSNAQKQIQKRLSMRNIKSAGKSDEKALEGDPTARLVMRNSVVLNELFEDPACSIVFVIEYVINVPLSLQVVNSEDKKKNTIDSKKQYETIHVIVRWAAWSPFSNNNLEHDSGFEINMYGGCHFSNPEKSLVFKIPDTKMQDEFSAKSAPGKMNFIFKKGSQLNFKPNQLNDYVSRQERPTSQLSDKNAVKSKEYEKSEAEESFNKPKLPDLVSQINPRQIYQAAKSKSFQDNQALMNQRQNTAMSMYSNMMQSHMMSTQHSQAFNDTQKVIGMFKGNLELYPLPNQPAHYPVLALEPGQLGGRTISRAAYAKLQNAKFPVIKDRFGKPAEVIDEMSYISFDLNKEESDPLLCNEIYFQFLAFSRMFSTNRNSYLQKPQNVFFTFQFYRFPEIKTPRLVLDDLIEDYSADPNSQPFILKYVEKEGVSKAKPGYMIQYNIDPSVLKFGEKTMFLKYLAYETIFIDVWDGDSLHLIGTSTLELKQLLRQGYDAVQAAYELDVLSTEYDDDSIANSAHTLKEGTPHDFNSHITLQGKLHIRIGNCGQPFDASKKSNEMLDELNPPIPLPISRVIASKTAHVNSTDKLLSRKLDEVTSKGFITHNLAKANHMTETFKEIHTALATDPNTTRSHSNDIPSDPLRKRKLNRMQMVRRLEENQTMPPELLGSHRRLIEERKKDLLIMDFYRKQTKHDQILNKLHEFATTEHVIYPTFGSVEFFEFVITNPYNEPNTITIISGDNELNVVTDVQEWRHLKLLHHMYGEVEENMFHREQSNMNGIKCPQLFLRPKETVHVPLKFQTFRADNSVENENKQHPALFNNNDKSYTQIGNATQKLYHPRKCPVEFRAQDGNPIAILMLIVEQQPHLINQTFRFNVPEHTFLKKNIRLPSSISAMAVTSTNLFGSSIKFNGTGENGQSRLFVRASDTSVISESRAVNFGEPHDIFVKAPVSMSPSVKKFHLVIFADQFLSVPLQIWQIYVHALQRIDISSIQGQTSRFSVILKGTQSSRYAQVFPSMPEEMAVTPNERFMLASSAVQEISVGVRPQNAGYKHYYLNVVDIEMHQLIYSWYIYIHSKPPLISKAFELTLPIAANVNPSNTTSKRVTYTNPYSTEKTFIVSTNRDDLLTFKETRIKFIANETKTLALKFLPNTKPGFVEVLVFINNENDTNEETFAIRATYVHSLESSTNYE